jgi:hypothetical protein
MGQAAESQPSSVATINRIVVAAMRAGWGDEEGFIAAVLMISAGVSAAEGERAFADAARRVQ